MKKKTAMRSASELRPNDVFEILGKRFRVRYLNYYKTSTSIQLQVAEDEISPFHDKTCMRLDIDGSVNAWFNVEVA